MTTRFLVRAVREREEYLPDLHAAIPTLEVVWDQHRQAMLTFLDALRTAGEDAAVHIEDDAVPCTGFMERCQPFLDGPNVVQGFSRLTEDVQLGSRWRPGSSFTGNVCFYLPAGMSKALLAYSPTWPHHEKHPTGYDLLMQDFFKARGVRYFQLVPSLVQHRIGVSAISPRRPRKRLSPTFQG